MKALRVIRNIFVWLIVAVAVCMMIFTIVSVRTFDRADRNLTCKIFSASLAVNKSCKQSHVGI